MGTPIAVELCLYWIEVQNSHWLCEYNTNYAREAMHGGTGNIK